MTTLPDPTLVPEVDRLDGLSRRATALAFLVGLVAAIAAPLWAVEWINRPFPGFFLDPTGVVSGAAVVPAGPAASLRYPERVIRIAGQPVGSTGDFDRALAGRSPGDTVVVFVQTPDGHERMVQPVELGALHSGLLLSRFWLPYLIGVAYLAIGLWVFTLQGHTRPGRALAFFCACTAVVTILLFDLTTTHYLPAVWTLAMALCGGALLSLAMRFPVELRLVTRRPWILVFPYLVSLGLAVWGAATLAGGDPWRYSSAWGASYRYAALGIVTFLAATLYHARAGASALVRRQARIVLLGSLLAFIPITVWFVSPLVGRPTPLKVTVQLPPLLLFPLSVGLAIVRYRLWEVDKLVNNTLVYGTLTAILAGVYTASIGLFQRLFVTMTGERSDAAIVMTTLIVAAAFTPIRTRLQSFMERRLRDPLTELKPLQSFGSAVTSYVELSDPNRVLERLVEQTATSLRADGASLRLRHGGEERVRTWGNWRNHAAASIPVQAAGQVVGVMLLGPRRDGSAYQSGEIEAAAKEVSQVVLAILPLAFPTPRGI